MALPIARCTASVIRQSTLALVSASTLGAQVTRTATGAPGRDYWQQRVDYDISATLDTSNHSIRGAEAIRYYNRSPNTLRALWIQLDQNLFKNVTGGFEVSAVERQPRPGARPHSLRSSVDGTMMRVDLDSALVSGDSMTIRIAFSFRIPENGAGRMGRALLDGAWVYAIAQWYPRLAVYDDLVGWNTDQYRGQGEFYLEYGDFDVRLTVPAGFVVAAGGELLNPEAVLSAVQRARLTRAKSSTGVVAVIDRSEAAAHTTQAASSPVTWHFRARNVRDFAWATSRAFAWDALAWNGVLVQAFYPADAHNDWSKSTAHVRETLAQYSRQWMRYPYPTAVAVATGLDSGMEYPMLGFEPARAGGRSLERVILHEFGHQWFPMIVGSNERRDAWMDEGLTTFINWIGIGYKPTGNGAGAERDAALGRPGPIRRMPDSLPPELVQRVAYDLPDVGLELLRHQILDDTLTFDRALREYVRRWAYKHPAPDDFFRTMNDVLGLDLGWFWTSWFSTTGVLDQAVDSVVNATDGERRVTARVFLSSRRELQMPVKLRLRLASGAVQDVKLPVDVWKGGRVFVYTRPVDSPVASVEIDSDRNFPDVDRSNNVWPRP